MQIVPYGGWDKTVRLSNREVEVFVTREVGPRVIRFGFVGGPNLFAEYAEQMGGTGETEWMIRGGHRLWIAPEDKALTYEPDNEPVTARAIRDGVRTVQPAGPLSGIEKRMDIVLNPRRNEVRIMHTLVNRGRRTARVAAWAPTVMAQGGVAIVPLPAKISHAKRLTHNQEWSLWAYTDLADPRWTFGTRYVFFRQDPKRGPNKLGLAHREGWVAYQLGEYLFVKKFGWTEGAAYPDGGVNFETFSYERMLEVESLGPLTDLHPGRSVRHEETWRLYRGVALCQSEADADRVIRPLARR